MDWKKTGNQTQPDRFGPDHWLQFSDGWTADGLRERQPVQCNDTKKERKQKEVGDRKKCEGTTR